MKLPVYVLHGHWETAETRGTIVVKVDVDEYAVISKMAEIIETKAAEYCKLCEDKLEIEQDHTKFEMWDMECGGFAGFYITQHSVTISNMVEYAIFDKIRVEYLLNDVGQALDDAFEREDIGECEYNTAKSSPAVLKSIAEQYEKKLDCNISFNDTMQDAINEVLGKLDGSIAQGGNDVSTGK